MIVTNNGRGGALPKVEDRGSDLDGSSYAALKSSADSGTLQGALEWVFARSPGTKSTSAWVHPSCRLGNYSRVVVRSCLAAVPDNMQLAASTMLCISSRVTNMRATEREGVASAQHTLNRSHRPSVHAM